MRLLLDTCAISELRQKEANRHLVDLLNAIDDKDTLISVISIGELIKGAALLEGSQKKREITVWISALERHYSDRLLPIDQETAHIWGEIYAKAQLTGRIIPAVDGLIAATALKNGLHLVTRNAKDFEATGVLLINPWENRNK